MWKKIVTVVLMLGMMVGISINTVAAGENQTEVLQVDERGSEISIMMVNITKQDNKLMISSSHDATVKCCLIGLRGVTKTSITATLQKKVGNSWTNVKTWTATTNSNKTSLTKTKNVAAGSSYRVKAVFRAYKGKSCETKTTFSEVKKG